jgi:WD40 repeat protein
MDINTVDPIIGRTLGDFLVKEKLGEGGFGAVYKANQVTLAREAVIKILHTRHRTNPQIIERFKREALLASRLEHPYCAHIYSFGAESDGLLWIAMEYVAGTPLNQVLKTQGAIPLERAVSLLDKICEVIHTAHEAGIIHRDIKPANVMVISRAGRLLPKLLDFGIAKGLTPNSVSPSDNENNGHSGNNGNNGNNGNKNGFNPLKLMSGVFSNNASNDGQITIIDENKGQPTIIAHQNNEEDVIVTNTNINQKTVVDNFSYVVKARETVSHLIVDTNNDGTVSEEDSKIQNRTSDTTEKINCFSYDIFEESKAYTIKTLGIIGSPAYMSPEQWDNGANVDARSDIYSLGILTYQVITGEHPFKESSYDLQNAHATKQVPPLKAGFPPLLDSVMQKVLAKRPQDRYQTALEFAKDFREAAGFSEHQINLPQLDEILKEDILTNAPKPLADTVASLVASRNTYQFRDRVLLVFHVLVHYVGILSLVSYASVSAKQQENELINKALQGLKQKGLNDTEWIDLSRKLCRPFAKKRDAFPIPELVNLFFEYNSEFLSPANETFARLLQLQEKIRSTISLKEKDLVDLLTEFLSKLTVLLRITTWLNDYFLVSPRGQFASEWMGAIKDFNVIQLRSNNLANGKATIVDANGYFVLSLWPLVEIVEPTDGEEKEVFLLECRGRSGAKLVSFPYGFEIESDAPWEWLREHFFTNEEKVKTDPLIEKSPYLGLATFSVKDANLFFGREKETENFLNRLRIQSLLAVVGPSGAGKSSFIQAGVIAGLSENWQVVTVRPGITPLSTLSTKLSKIVVLDNLKESLEKDIDALGKALREFATSQNKPVLIVVDQFEEIFTLCLNKEEQRLYVEALVSATRSEEDPVRVVLTMRDDFLVRAKELSGLKHRLTQGLEILTTPASEELLKILILPARRAGYEFEDKELPQEIVESLSGQTSALPLLAFTAAKLWEQRDKQFKQLRRRSYEAMGGVAGALAKHAEEMLEKMTIGEQTLVREAFRHLVTSEGMRAFLTRQELLQLLGKSDEAETVVEKLISTRLLVTAEGEKGVDRIEIIHETLLTAWPRLVKWRQEDQESSRLRDQLRSAARQWQERGKPRGLLWRDEALAEYQIWRAHHKSRLTELEEEFATASIAEANRSQRIKQMVVAAIVIILIISSAVMFYQRQQTKEQLMQTLKLYEEQGRQEMLKGNLDGAAIYLSEAYNKGANSQTLRYMLRVALAKAENRPPLTLASHKEAVTMAIFSPDDALVATVSKDKTAKIWQATDGKELFTLKGHEDTIVSCDFSRDGSLLVTASLDKTAKIWKVSDASLVATLSGHTDGIEKAIFSPDGKQVVTISYDKTAKLWESNTGKLISTLEGHSGAITAVGYSKDGKRVATASSDRTAKIWDSATGKLESTLTGHQTVVLCLDFSPNGTMLATGSIDKTAKVWQVASGNPLYTLSGHQTSITDVKFSADGQELLTTSSDTTARLWDAKTGSLLHVLDGHKGDITKGGFSPDGKLIITSSFDKSLRIWDRETGKFLFALTDHENALNSGIFSSKGDRILTASEDKKARIWPLVAEERSPEEIATLVKEKVPGYLQEGRLIMAVAGVKKDNLPEIAETPKHTTENIINEVYVEDLGNDIKIEMVKIAGGTFVMGSPPDEKERGGDETQHTVTLSGFYISKYKVTEKLWKTVAALPRINKTLSVDPSDLKGDNLPVTNISWGDAMEFCARLSRLTGKEYRLPTESEWEYACRAGTKGAYPGNLDEMTWYTKNANNMPHPVGLKKPNAWGLYDINGNGWEWCMDWYGVYPKEPTTDPKGVPAGSGKVIRGGNWINATCRSADRAFYFPENTSLAGDIAFRLVLNLR